MAELSFQKRNLSAWTADRTLRRIQMSKNPTISIRLTTSQRRYLDAFDQAQLAFVGREVDPWLMQKFDYDVI